MIQFSIGWNKRTKSHSTRNNAPLTGLNHFKSCYNIEAVTTFTKDKGNFVVSVDCSVVVCSLIQFSIGWNKRTKSHSTRNNAPLTGLNHFKPLVVITKVTTRVKVKEKLNSKQTPLAGNYITMKNLGSP
ncbi:hypothetical protein MU1_00470 [Paenibacillus glycanilyticus]|uniref:Uncharacterized protein n=1 Tax=Paenibacillus glycanilyticus TaxID=126569 RepID=A0ABQ6G8V8_9BACL|nr:hypothetical protein MU1_00470 [Paenibacillus glycanilyticus]